MTKRRQHVLPTALVTATAALMTVGCSSDSDKNAGSNTTEGAAVDDVALDGVRMDVRRDPG